MVLQELLGLGVKPVGQGLGVGHAQGVDVRETVVPGAPGKGEGEERNGGGRRYKLEVSRRVRMQEKL